MQKEARESNFEILKIVSMLMIVSLHTFQVLEKMSLDDLTAWRVLDMFGDSLCICCVNVFVLISGYFGIKWKARSFLSLVF